MIIGDLHIGARNSNKIVEHWQQRFFEEQFWPYIEQHNIKNIIQLGDWFDNRRWINLNSMAFNKAMMVDKINELNITVHTMIGNHDIPYKHSLANNSPQQIMGHEPNINIWQEPGNFTIDDVNFTMIPWICKENEVECMEAIQEGGDICIGHFEIAGFNMMQNHKNIDGLNASLFEKWNTVWSGHFHTQSKNANIHYLGTPYQMSWNDFMPKNGFWVFDTHDRSLVFINNPLRYFHRIEWNDGSNYPVENIENSYVKLSIKKKTDFEAFEKFLDKINFHRPFELKVLEDFEEYSSENIEDLINVASTQELINQYIDDVSTEKVNKGKVKEIMQDIYKISLEVEE
ncbi:MAG: metallophosphoesterase [Candidatus Thiodiazotropha taylori]|uniref:Metallophosphoesterase n=1 Tax=Candidatus Thiodiazotropha taylori TaxID=2792791 RepID=A0A9E4N389_9GAMM|nr:metallophosphoesterase [Candidatus Thiodiazotropha taylori]MCW4255070.1 metallophosphoesterase [Candidatus Thiodiazotropha taylori]